MHLRSALTGHVKQIFSLPVFFLVRRDARHLDSAHDQENGRCLSDIFVQVFDVSLRAAGLFQAKSAQNFSVRQ